jgi:hypothetical protein
MKNLILLVLVFLISCNQKPKEKVKFKKCVITSISVIRNKSSIEFGLKYFYHTDCDVTFTNRKNIYQIGDTINIID